MSKLELLPGSGTDTHYSLDDGTITVPTEQGLMLAGSVKDLDTLSGNPYHDPNTGKFSDSPFGWLKKLGQAEKLLKSLDKGAVKAASQQPGFGAAMKNADGIFARQNGDGTVTMALVNGNQVLHAVEVRSDKHIEGIEPHVSSPMSKDVDHARLEKMISKAPDANEYRELPTDTHGKLASSIQSLFSGLAEGDAGEALDNFYDEAYSGITGQEKPRGRFVISESSGESDFAVYIPTSGNISIDEKTVQKLQEAGDRWVQGKDITPEDVELVNTLVHEVSHSTKDLDAQYLLLDHYMVGDGDFMIPTLSFDLEEGSVDALATWRTRKALESLGVKAEPNPQYPAEKDWIDKEFISHFVDEELAHEELARIHHENGWGLAWSAQLNAALMQEDGHEINPWTAPHAGVDPSNFHQVSDRTSKLAVIAGLVELPSDQLAEEIEWSRDHGTGFQYSAAVKARAFRENSSRVKGYAAPIKHLYAGIKWPKKESDLKVINTNLGGSTGAKLVEGPDGSKFVLKGGDSPDHIKDELAADAVYQALGVDVPPIAVTETGKKLAVFMSGSQYSTISNPTLKEKAKVDIRKGFGADALLGNWDVIGLSGDNVMMLSSGKPVRIDNGGSLRFRGMGGKKPESLYMAPVSEIWSMRGKTSVQNKTAQDVFGDMEFEDVAAQIKDIVSKKNTVFNAVDDKKLREILEHRMRSFEYFDKAIDQARHEEYSWEEIDAQLQKAVDAAGSDTDKLESYGLNVVYDQLDGDGLTVQDPPKPPETLENISNDEYQKLWTPGDENVFASDLKVGDKIEHVGEIYEIQEEPHKSTITGNVTTTAKNSEGHVTALSFPEGTELKLVSSPEIKKGLESAKTPGEKKTLLAAMSLEELQAAYKAEPNVKVQSMIWGYIKRKKGISSFQFEKFMASSHTKAKWLEFFEKLNEEQFRDSFGLLLNKHIDEKKQTTKAFETWSEAVLKRGEEHHETELVANLSAYVKLVDSGEHDSSLGKPFTSAAVKAFEDYAKTAVPQAVKDATPLNKDVAEFPDNYDDLKVLLGKNEDKFKVSELPIGSVYDFKNIDAVAKKISDDVTMLYWDNGNAEKLSDPMDITPPKVAVPNKFAEMPDSYKEAKAYLIPNDNLTTIKDLPTESIFNVKTKVVKKLGDDHFLLLHADGTKQNVNMADLSKMGTDISLYKAPTKIAVPGGKKPAPKETVKKAHLKKLETIVSPLELDKFGYQASSPSFWQSHANNVGKWKQGTKAAVKDYGGGGYGQINSHLRGIHKGGPHTVKRIKEMDGAYVHIEPLQTGITTFRGVGGGNGHGDAANWFKEIKNAKIGEEFIDHGFLSTSKKFGTANSFGNGAVVEVRIPAGAKVIDMQDSAVKAPHAGEHEVVLGRGAKLVYLGVNGNGIPVVFLKGHDRRDPDSFIKTSANPASGEMTYPEMKQSIGDQINNWEPPNKGTDFKGHAAAVLAAQDGADIKDGQVSKLLDQYMPKEEDPEEFLTWMKAEDKEFPEKSFVQLTGVEFNGTVSETNSMIKKLKMEMAKLPLEDRKPYLEKTARLQEFTERRGKHSTQKPTWNKHTESLKSLVNKYSKDIKPEELEEELDDQQSMIAMLKPNKDKLTLKQLPVGSVFGKGPGHSVAKKSGANSIDVWHNEAFLHTKQPNDINLIPAMIFIPKKAGKPSFTDPNVNLAKSTVKALSALEPEKNFDPVKVHQLFTINSYAQSSYIKQLSTKEFDKAFTIAMMAPSTNIALLHVFEARALQMFNAHGGKSWEGRLAKVKKAIAAVQKGA